MSFRNITDLDSKDMDELLSNPESLAILRSDKEMMEEILIAHIGQAMRNSSNAVLALDLETGHLQWSALAIKVLLEFSLAAVDNMLEGIPKKDHNRLLAAVATGTSKDCPIKIILEKQ